MSDTAYPGEMRRGHFSSGRYEVFSRSSAAREDRRCKDGFCIISLNSATGVVVGKRRQLILFLFGALALAGLYEAVRNLPVMTGCSFYAECPNGNSEFNADAG